MTNAAHIKTLADKAILIGVNVSCFTGAKKDKKATAQVVSDNHIAGSDNNVRVWKNLMKSEKLSKVTNAAQKIRVTLYRVSAPWNDSSRIVKISNFLKAKFEIEECIREFNTFVQEAVADYDNMILADKVKLGNLYNPNDYPSKAHFAASFSAKILVEPIKRDDFRSDVLSPEDVEDINKQIEERINAASKEVERDLISRVNEKLTHLLSRLLADGKFHSSSIENVKEAIKEARDLNINDNPKLNDLFKVVEESVGNLSAEEIRDNNTVRDAVIDEVRENIAKVSDAMSEFMV